jgi:hypothetical protein
MVKKYCDICKTEITSFKTHFHLENKWTFRVKYVYWPRVKNGSSMEENYNNIDLCRPCLVKLVEQSFEQTTIVA